MIRIVKSSCIAADGRVGFMDARFTRAPPSQRRGYVRVRARALPVFSISAIQYDPLFRHGFRYARNEPFLNAAHPRTALCSLNRDTSISIRYRSVARTLSLVHSRTRCTLFLADDVLMSRLLCVKAAVPRRNVTLHLEGTKMTRLPR